MRTAVFTLLLFLMWVVFGYVFFYVTASANPFQRDRKQSSDDPENQFNGHA